MLQGIYSENRLDIAEDGNLKKYRQELSKMDDEEVEGPWKNSVIRSWNGIIQSGADQDKEEMDIVVEMLTTELQELEEMFVTHFGKSGRFFMTSSSTWTSLIPMYVKALDKYADEMAQRPGGPPLLQKIRRGLPEKMQWVMMNHGRLHMAPPFPLMTRSTVAAVADSLRDIGLAIYEVSCGFHRIYLAGRTYSTCEEFFHRHFKSTSLLVYASHRRRMAHDWDPSYVLVGSEVTSKRANV